MKKKITYIIMVTILTVSFLTACSLMLPQPEETLYRYEAAFNEYDIESMVKCFEPSVQKLYDGGMEIGSSFLGMDMNTIIGAAGGFMDLFGDELIDGGMPEMSISINSKNQVSDDTVVMNITCDVTNMDNFVDGCDEEMSENMDVCLVLINGEWYISAESEMPGM